MKSLFRTSLGLSLVTSASVLALVSCGADDRALGSQDQSDSAGALGDVGLALNLPGSAVLSSVSYTVTGPNGFSKAGTSSVANSSNIAFQLSLPSGGPYSITLSGTSTDGNVNCGGVATFSVVARQTTKLSVHLTCKEAPRTGSVLVSGEINTCPVIDQLSATPAEVVVGQTIALSTAAHDSDAGPSALTYAWSASSGTLSSAAAKNPTFTCTAPGTSTITLSVSDGDASVGCADTQTTSVTCTKNTLTMAMFGDWPYGNVIDSAPGFIAQVNADPDIELALHVGDIHSGSQACSAAYNLQIFNYFQQFNDPLVYTPGDNEWTDCQKAKEFSSGYPIDELTKLRAQFFSTPGKTLGTNAKVVSSQANAYDPTFPDDAAYVENVMWEQASVMFVTLNVPGSNDDRLPWAGAFANPTAQADEIAKRDAANSHWLARAFTLATAHGDAALLIGLQADMWDPAAAVAGGDGLSGYDALVAQIASASLAFGKPVLLVNGDSHLYEADHPLADPTAAAYAYHPIAAPVPNLTRITVDGSTNFKDWVKLVVDPTTPSVFSWTRINTP